MSGRPLSSSGPAQVSVRTARWTALAAAVGLVLLVVLGPALTRTALRTPVGGDRSPAAVTPGTGEPAVVAAPQPRTPGPLLLPLLVALVAGLLVLTGRTGPATARLRSSTAVAGLVRWRARLVGAPPIPASLTSH